MPWMRFWMPEEKGKWQPIDDGTDVQDRAREMGAMFLTTHAIDGDPAQDPPPNRRGDMHLDFDSDTEPGLVLEEMVKAIAHLETAYGVDPYQLEIFLSGGKGGHIEIPATIVGIEPGPFLHLEQKRFACKLAADLDLKTLDTGIYSGGLGRQFRLPNVQRNNGRYKVQIMPSELAGLHGKELMELTKAPRTLDLDELPNEPTLAEPLKDIFLYFRDQVKAEQAALADREPLDADTVKKLTAEIPPCIRATLRLTSRPPKGNFNQIILNLATYFNAAGADLKTALETSWAFLEGYQESSVYKTQDARIRHFKEMFLYVQGNPRFVFDCGFSLGLGLPGNWFDCRACQLSERKPEPEQPDLKLNDIINFAYDGQKGCADLFVLLNRNQFCFDHTDGVWFEFCGHHWKPEDIGKPVRALDQVQALFERGQATLDGDIVIMGQKIKQATTDKEKDKIKAKVASLQAQSKTLGAIIRNLNTLGYRKQVVEFAAQGPNSLGITGQEWDLLPWALGVQNGIVDLRTGELRPGSPRDYLRAVSPVCFDPAAKCPLLEQALADIFKGNQKLIRFVQRVFGMALVGANIEHVLIVLYGVGRNGKDVIISTIAHVLGPALAGPVQSELLLDQGRLRSSSGPSADIMRLRGLRVAWASETNEGRRLDAGKIKLMTGGGDLVGRAPYARREISFPQSFTLFLLTNSKPHAPAEDYALWKRLKLVPFNIQFVDEPTEDNERERDKYLLDKLKKEAPGILNWLLHGCLEWQRTGLEPPEEVERATLEYRDEEDLLLQFVKDACLTGPEYQAPAGQLYKHYREWMTGNGLKPMSNQKFGRRMGERHHKENLRTGAVYQGIGITDFN